MVPEGSVWGPDHQNCVKKSPFIVPIIRLAEPGEISDGRWGQDIYHDDYKSITAHLDMSV